MPRRYSNEEKAFALLAVEMPLWVLLLLYSILMTSAIAGCLYVGWLEYV